MGQTGSIVVVCGDGSLGSKSQLLQYAKAIILYSMAQEREIKRMLC